MVLTFNIIYKKRETYKRRNNRIAILDMSHNITISFPRFKISNHRDFDVITLHTDRFLLDFIAIVMLHPQDQGRTYAQRSRVGRPCENLYLRVIYNFFLSDPLWNFKTDTCDEAV